MNNYSKYITRHRENYSKAKVELKDCDSVSNIEKLEKILEKSKNSQVKDSFWEKERESFERIEKNNLEAGHCFYLTELV